MTTYGDEPSVFAKYITEPGIIGRRRLKNWSSSPRRHADLKTFLIGRPDDGPSPTTLIQERGAAHGFSRKQLYCARQQMNIVAFKEVGKRHGRWFWGLPQHAGYPGTANEQPQKTP